MPAKYRESRGQAREKSRKALGTLARIFGVGGTAKKIVARDKRNTAAGKKAKKTTR